MKIVFELVRTADSTEFGPMMADAIEQLDLEYPDIEKLIERFKTGKEMLRQYYRSNKPSFVDFVDSVLKEFTHG